MPLYIKDETVNQLAVLVMETIGAESKTEAVRKALIAQLNAVKQKRLLLESVRDLQDKVEPSPVCRRLQSKYGWSLWKKVTEQTGFRPKCAHARFG